eukprot:TRINITY_DN560_c0_g1_i2.p1 TRINITY_DN560_c0_g1~~TRINITY_DN560_c0_g1_i2.p1  ORF type:complete len:106 (+),score=7.30 TRINITY_DN560_c0_g1_i2:32-349(+)
MVVRLLGGPLSASLSAAVVRESAVLGRGFVAASSPALCSPKFNPRPPTKSDHRRAHLVTMASTSAGEQQVAIETSVEVDEEVQFWNRIQAHQVIETSTLIHNCCC